MITQKDIVKETLEALKIIHGKRLINYKTTGKELEKRGFDLISLGTGGQSYICSREIKIVDCRKNTVFYNDKLLLVVGISNLSYGMGKIYRGFAQEIQDSENLSAEEVKNLKNIIEDAKKTYKENFLNCIED